jgi:PST family polysaccharide transporter
MFETGRIKVTVRSHKTVIENYFFMTVLQFLNSFFYFFILPYLFGTIGKEGYGLYVFAFSIVTYCISLIDFGFSLPGLKAIAEHHDNRSAQSTTVSAIITAKSYLFLAVTPIFAGVVYGVPMLRESWLIFAVCYIQVLARILFQDWFFQGVQKMGIVALIQLITKLLSLAFIFGLVKNSGDVWLFALITSCATLLGGVLAYLIAYREGIRVKWASRASVKRALKDGLPFFATTCAATIKWQANPILLGTFFTMGDVAVYDLAYKVILLPITVLTSVSGALFPKVIKEYSIRYVKKIIRFNGWLGVGATIATVLLGKYGVFLLGGEQMSASYGLVVVLSLTILPWLVNGAYANFLLVPNKCYYNITKTQLIALVTHVAVCISAILLFKSSYAVAVAMLVACMAEFLYLRDVVKRKKLLIP